MTSSWAVIKVYWIKVESFLFVTTAKLECMSVQFHRELFFIMLKSGENYETWTIGLSTPPQMAECYWLRYSIQATIFTWLTKHVRILMTELYMTSLIASFMGSKWGPSGADRTQVRPMLAPWTLLSGSDKWDLHHSLTHLPLVPHICFCESSQHWFR